MLCLDRRLNKEKALHHRLQDVNSVEKYNDTTRLGDGISVYSMEFSLQNV